MKKLKIALLAGGKSSEREVSLNGGKEVFSALDKEKYDVSLYDPAYDLKRLASDSDNIDFALIILHGSPGEDGSIQGFLDVLEIPYQGSGVLGSAMAMNKLVSKKIYATAGIPTPAYMAAIRGENFDIKACIEKLSLPVIVKPAACGSSIGIKIAETENTVNKALDAAFMLDKEVLIEEYIDGIELTCGVLGSYGDAEALPLIKIMPAEKYNFFDYKAKYEKGATIELCPAPIDENIAQKAQNLGIKAHEALCCEDYSRTDMILKDEKLFVLETNTIPGMTSTSLFPQSVKEAGYSFSALLDKLIALGIESKKKA